MPELTLTVVGGPGDTSDEGRALDALMAELAREAGRLATLERRPGLGQTEGPPRVFVARFSEPDALSAVIRGTGGWYMRNPGATITFKISSSKGGKTLQMTSYSPVGMARAIAEMKEYLEV